MTYNERKLAYDKVNTPEELQEFMDKYCDFKYCEDPSELPDGYQDNFMSDLEVLVNKYYPKD